VRLSRRVKGGIVDINGEGELSGPWVGSTVRLRFSKRNTGLIGLQLDFRSISDVRASARLSFKFKLKCG